LVASAAVRRRVRSRQRITLMIAGLSSGMPWACQLFAPATASSIASLSPASVRATIYSRRRPFRAALTLPPRRARRRASCHSDGRISSAETGSLYAAHSHAHLERAHHVNHFRASPYPVSLPTSTDNPDARDLSDDARIAGESFSQRSTVRQSRAQ
jgi:hypothetical protein